MPRASRMLWRSHRDFTLACRPLQAGACRHRCFEVIIALFVLLGLGGIGLLNSHNVAGDWKGLPSSQKCGSSFPSCGPWDEACEYEPLFKPASLAGAKLPRTLKWDPPSNRFLLMYCHFGQMSNLLRCMKNHLLASGLLNRTLVMPFQPDEVEIGYDLRVVFDLSHAKICYGHQTMLTTDEYQRAYGGSLEIDEVLCWREQSCPAKNLSQPVSEQVKPIRFVEFTPGLTATNKNLSNKIPFQSFHSTFARSQARGLLIGDFFDQWITGATHLYTSGDVPFSTASNCPNSLAIQPHSAIIAAAKSFISSELGNQRYIAIHLRRSFDFQLDCQKYFKEMCGHPISQVAKFVRDKLMVMNTSLVFLATDAAEAEVMEFAKGVQGVGAKKTRIVQLSVKGNSSEEGWGQILNSSGLQLRKMLEVATLEKVVCALAEGFLGTAWSTFSLDIERLRYGLGTATCEDVNVCENEAPEELLPREFLEEKAQAFWETFRLA